MLTSLRRLPIALVYRSTAGWYLPVLKATFPSSLVFSAIAKVSGGSDTVGGEDVVGRGVSGSMFEPDPDAWLAQKISNRVLFCFFCLKYLSLVPFGADLHVAVAAVPAACRFFTPDFAFLFVIKVIVVTKIYNVMLVNLVADDEGKKKKRGKYAGPKH